MVILRKDEEQWWYAQHPDGRRGQIPTPYVEPVHLNWDVRAPLNIVLRRLRYIAAARASSSESRRNESACKDGLDIALSVSRPPNFVSLESLGKASLYLKNRLIPLERFTCNF